MNVAADAASATWLAGLVRQAAGHGRLRAPPLARSLSHAWDRWLQSGLTRLRERHDDWTERYLKAPLWCFVLGEGVIGAGALARRADALGRWRRPLLSLHRRRPSWRAAADELHGEALARVQQLVDARPRRPRSTGWSTTWTRCASMPRCSRLFARLRGRSRRSRRRRRLALPACRGQSLWFTDPDGERGHGHGQRRACRETSSSTRCSASAEPRGGLVSDRRRSDAGH